MSGEVALDGMIARLRAVRSLAVDAARRAAPKIEAIAKRTAAAGTTPDGKPWTPLKRGEGRPLANAAEFISARSIGALVQVVLRGPYVLHNFGTGHAPQRRILPDGATGLPPGYKAALRQAAAEAFAAATGGSR